MVTRCTPMTGNLRLQTTVQSNRGGNSGTGSRENAGADLFSGSGGPPDETQSRMSTTDETGAIDSPEVRTSGTPDTKEPMEPLTVSLPSSLARQARIVVVARGITMSKFVTGLLEAAVAKELPSILADLSGSLGGRK